MNSTKRIYARVFLPQSFFYLKILLNIILPQRTQSFLNRKTFSKFTNLSESFIPFLCEKICHSLFLKFKLIIRK